MEQAQGARPAAAGLPVVNKIGLDAPFSWLAQGGRDFASAFIPCLLYGLGIAIVSYFLARALVVSDLAFWALVLSCGFVFVAPMLAMGLYEAGRQIESGAKPTLSQMLFVKGAVRLDVAYLGLALVLIFFLWTRLAQIVYGLSTYSLHTTVEDFVAFALTTSDGHTMLIAGAIVGGIIAFVTFALVVVSAPMLLDQNANVFAAVITSLTAASRNFAPLLLWAFIIAALLIVAALTWFIALAVIFPWLGLASWRAYRALVQS
ncbi:MAG: DUF2189 domain-containing protein [Hyphomonadaceae bacterium]|nr:DUF2189 domain-containing protein [Hyphomonadaceae bacterium]